MRYLPNAITISRIALTPFLLGLLMVDALWARSGALLLFLLAAISDYVDGRLARRYGVRSRLGQFLDPLADKVLVLGTFMALAVLVPAIVPWWAVLIIALRDLLVTGLRTWAEARGHSVQTHALAKVKTALQLGFLVGMLLLLAVDKVPGPLGRSGRWALESPIPFLVLLLLLVITVYTGALYLFQQEKVTPAQMKGSSG